MSHRDMDDTADFAATRFGPAEACTEVGADHLGCGPGGNGPGPLVWLLRGVVVAALLLVSVWLVAGGHA